MQRRSAWLRVLLGLLVWILLPQKSVQAQGDRTFEKCSTEVDALSRRWDQKVSRVGGEYQRQATIVWEQYRRQIDRIWDTFRRTTDKVWADYSDDTTAHTVVDFEQGTIDVEVVIPSADPNARQKAADRVKAQFLQTFAKEVSPGQPVLEGQPRTQTGQAVTPQNVDRFAETEVQGTARVEKRFQSQDGVERLKVTHAFPWTMRIRITERSGMRPWPSSTGRSAGSPRPGCWRLHIPSRLSIPLPDPQRGPWV